MESVAQRSVIATMGYVVVLTGHVNASRDIEAQFVTKVSLIVKKR